MHENELRSVLERFMGSTAASAMTDALKVLFPREWNSEDTSHLLEFECVHCGRVIRGEPTDTLQVCPYCYRANWYAPCPSCGTVTAAKGPGVHVCPSCGSKVRVRMNRIPDQAAVSSEIDTEAGFTRVMDAVLMLRALYVLVGQMVAVDGWITRDEMNQLDVIFGELGIPLDEFPDDSSEPLRFLKRGVNSPEGYRKVLFRVKELMSLRPGFADFGHLAVEILTRIAFSDGTLSDDEAHFLWDMRDIWELEDAEFEEDLMTALSALGLDAHYRALGVHPLATWQEIEEACVRLMEQERSGNTIDDVARTCEALKSVRSPS